jgi:ketosteroid isomerase-like protein
MEDRMTLAPDDVATAFVAALNGRDPDVIFGLLADDATYVTPRGETVAGATMVNKMMCASWGTFPDGRLVEVRRFHDEDSIVIQARHEGTNTGPIGWAGGAAATGRSVDIHQCYVLDVRDGRVCSAHLYMDRLTVNEQLGLTG